MQRTIRLGRYHLTDRIGYGGMAEIFRGVTYDRDGYRRDVAVKKLLPNYVKDKRFITMLTDEFKLARHLRHPNIAEVYELCEVEDTVLISMEYVDGKDLRSVVDKSKRVGREIGFDNIAYVLAKALDGLQHAHVARDDHQEPLGVVHRDFSPSNILVSYDGRVKICDFGIAKANLTRIKTKTGIIKGKVKYMSPEQAFGRRLDWRSDIFSAGSVLYELCTGQPPFSARNEIDLIFAVRDASPVDCRDLNTQIPDDLAKIIAASMRRSRSGRFQSALDFRDALLRFLQAYNPTYRRTRLSSLLRDIWAEEIEKELRTMEDLVLDDAPVEDLGRNLIADSLGPDARYVHFNPRPALTADDLTTDRVPGHSGEPFIDPFADEGTGDPTVKESRPPVEEIERDV